MSKLTNFSRFKNRFADRGQGAERDVQRDLEAWRSERAATTEVNRLVDTKAAGRTIKAAAADFDFYTVHPSSGVSFHGLLEVKETLHDYRLGRDRITQLPRLRLRAKCGGKCAVLIYHSNLNKWRVLEAATLHQWGDKGSWNMSELPLYATPLQALQGLFPEVFL